MSSTGSDRDDPLDRLAAEEDWSGRFKAVEKDVARSRRKDTVRRLRSVRVRGPRKVSGWFLAFVALTMGSAVALWFDAPGATYLVFVFVLAGWLVTLCLHEFAHALAAYRGGDETVVEKGYLRLDPKAYGHWVLTLLLPLLILLVGGLPLPGGAVNIESHRLRNRFRDSLVSLAGPSVNVIAAFVLLLVLAVFGPAWITDIDAPHAAFWAALTFFAYIQVAAAILNLLPVPGLDGYGIIEPYLPHSTRRIGNMIKPFGIIVVFLLLFLPPFRALFSAVIQGFLDLAGVPVNGGYYGSRLFQFWREWRL